MATWENALRLARMIHDQRQVTDSEIVQEFWPTSLEWLYSEDEQLRELVQGWIYNLHTMGRLAYHQLYPREGSTYVRPIGEGVARFTDDPNDPDLSHEIRLASSRGVSSLMRGDAQVEPWRFHSTDPLEHRIASELHHIQQGSRELAQLLTEYASRR